ncbi:MAG TPA: amino acid transporter, partial [Blastocatellia bacterium]|nr:amino acid transporter [Blastocatellia bacterium]
MAEATEAITKKTISSFRRWFFEGQVKEVEGPHEKEGQHHKHSWWQVMCLTGVDYFSTLGYQPGIAFLAAGALSPIATLILVLLTLFGALPMYRRVAEASPHGDGSISMLEDLLPRWRGKMFVLALMGFAATSFIITITLSAADATAHIIENPFAPNFLRHSVGVTLFLIAALGAIFLKGFKEAIGLAVLLVAIYISLNLVVVCSGLYQVAIHPGSLVDWKNALNVQHGSLFGMIGAAMLLFPKLALGLSGFETGVLVLPLVKGDETDSPQNPAGRIRNGKKLLLAAAAIMSLMLISSSFITSILIPAAEFQEGGKAYGRALAYLAHKQMGDIFGTIYDLSTISILWFAGSSALAGLLNLIPRYLPRYGMAPEWARAVRPLTVVLTVICFAVTIVFNASVKSQGDAYSTGVLALILSAAIAVAISEWRNGWRRWIYLSIAAVFGYTTVLNIAEQPQGIKIATLFIASIIGVSFISRAMRSTELRVVRVELNDA